MNGGLEQPSPDHLVVVTVHVGRCHVDSGMNTLVVSSQQLGEGVQVLQGVVGGHVLVSERGIKPFGHDRFGFPRFGLHVSVVKFFTLVGLQLHGTAWCRFVF